MLFQISGVGDSSTALSNAAMASVVFPVTR